MKATGGRVVGAAPVERRDPEPGDGWRDREAHDFPEKEEQPVEKYEAVSRDPDSEKQPKIDPESLVMILMPKVTHDEFVKLSARTGGSAAEAMSVALKLLQTRLDEKDAKDGS